MALARSEYDSPWKDFLDNYLGNFLGLTLPLIHGDIDWSVDHESHEQELPELSPGSESGKRLADKLVKVTTLANDIRYLHLEAQGKKEEGFERRVHTYNYRAEDRYGQPVVSVVVLADEDPQWRPTRYQSEVWGCKRSLEFLTIKLLDFVGKEAELEANPNPAALFLRAHLAALATREDPQARFELKLRLTLQLYSRFVDGEEVRRWGRYLDWMMPLPQNLARRLLDEVARFERENKMPFITSFEQLGLEKGMEKGLEQGLEKGLEKGLEQGMEKAVRSSLKAKFGAEGEALLSGLQLKLTEENVGALVLALAEASTLEKAREELAART